MIRNVDLVSYLPQFMKDYKEEVLALDAENPEFFLMWVAKDRVLYNRFIETADEYGISRYEQMLNIHPVAEDTLESRRSRVRSMWFNTIPYNMQTLIQKLIVLCGSRDNFIIADNFTEGYTLTLLTDLELFGQVEELERIIDTMIPCNIDVNSLNMFPFEIQGGSYPTGCIGWVDMDFITNDFREVYDSEGHEYLANGITDYADVLITNDFKEEYDSQGKGFIANSVSDCAFVQITNDFSESYESEGNSNISAGMTVAEIITTESED